MGNIRELSNMCERLVVLNQNGMIDEEDILAIFPQMDGDRASGNMNQGRELKKSDDEFTEQVKRLEKDRITTALKQAGNHKIKASEYLGISRTTLWRRIKELEIN
jgi:DNA-binding NtrC family response regulator